MWFIHQLVLADVVLLPARKPDKKDRLWQLGSKANLPVLCLLAIALWGSAQILNTPVIEIDRNGIYIFSYLIGYSVFSHDRIQELLAKWACPLLGIAVVLAVVMRSPFPCSSPWSSASPSCAPCCWGSKLRKAETF